jgi:hypothetical protein
MAPFTTYFECTWPAGGPSAEVELQLHVPATRCPDRLLPQLAVFAMEEGLGWYRVSDQALDAATRTFRARNDAPAHYAVLGPEQLVPGADPEPTPVTGAAPQAEITP